jgi:hypothetical protein
MYNITVDNEHLGSFGFTKGQPTQEFDFRLAPRAGDLAPE